MKVPKNNRQLRNADGDVSIAELLGILWQGWLTIMLVLAVFLVASIFVALSLPDKYLASVLLAPTSSQGSSELSSIAGRYSGLASLAGVNLGDTANNKTDHGLETLKSRKFLMSFINRNNLLPALIAATDWNASQGSFNYDESKYDSKRGTWVRKERPPRKVQPTLLEGYEAFREIISISRSSENGFVTVELEHYSPTQTTFWLEKLVADLNQHIREKDIEAANNAIQYLQEQLSQTSLAELRDVFYSLIEEQTKIVMLAHMSDEYLFEIIDPPVVPEEPSRPNRVLIVILGVIAGLMFGVLVQLLQFFSKR